MQKRNHQMSLMINDCWSAEDHKEILQSSSEKLWRFVQQHGSLVEKNIKVENLTGLSQNQIRQLATIHLLLSKEVQEFVEKIAPNILRKISKSSLQETDLLRGRIRGKVNWTKTVLKHQTEKDPSIFLCINRSPVFDLVENKVLLYCLRYLLQIGQTILNKGIDRSESLAPEYLDDQDKWMKKVSYILLNCQKLLKSPLLRNVTELHGINYQHIEKTRKARGQQYYYLAQIAELIYIQKDKPITFLHDVLANQMLQPLSRDTLFEIAVVFRILDTFKQSGWKESKTSLIGEGQKVLSVIHKEDWIINIYYQQIPTHFVKQSRYKELMKDAHLSVKHRRPDILLEWIDKGGKSKYTIVEVKRSQNRDYLADGLYKVLGYLKDFEQPMHSTVHSAGLLVGWKIKNLGSPKEQKEVYTTDWAKLHLFVNQLEENFVENSINKLSLF
jgi:hypothetical protein